MSKFKGSKGEWKFEYDNSSSEWFDIFSDNGSLLSRNYNDKLKSFEEIKANALLISKAPKMLEMLKSVLEIQKSYIGSANIELVYKTKEIEQLIKEATEL